jgi:hypothetical protein
MLKVSNYIRSLGLGGFLSGGLAGLLFLLYSDTFPTRSNLEGIMLIGAFLGAACQRLADPLIIKPFLYYASLVQLLLLRRHIGERTRNEIIQQLTRKYFLGEYDRNRAPFPEHNPLCCSFHPSRSQPTNQER